MAQMMHLDCRAPEYLRPKADPREGTGMRSSLNWQGEDTYGRIELVPDQVLPVQFAELMQRTSERTPELRLMAAVLEDAIRIFCRYVGSRRLRGRRLFRETADWFDSREAGWVFAFENVCDALGLDSGWIRGLLRRWMGKQAAMVEQPAKIASVRRMAGSRHTITARAPGLRRSTKLAC